MTPESLEPCAAGAVILGKTNTSQFAGFRNSASLNGSTLGGGTHNPYDITRSAAGSSNGSGIAAAMSFAAATTPWRVACWTWP